MAKCGAEVQETDWGPMYGCLCRVKNDPSPDYPLARRDYFAAAAMQAIVSRFDAETKGAAKCAVEYADALLAELDKEK